MRKVLLGTTALATAGLIAGGASDAAAADRIKIGVHGYNQQFVVGLSQDVDTNDPGRMNPGPEIKHSVIDEKFNSEICFVGETTLDNGITVGVNVQLEGQLSPGGDLTGDVIDEQYLYMQSDRFGRLILGSENNAGYLLSVGSPDGGISVDSGDVINDSFYVNTAGLQLFDTPTGTTQLRLQDNDSNKITYITPRYWGFQAGVSYIPTLEQRGADNNTPNYNANPAAGLQGLHNGWAGGLNYKNTFGNFGVQLSGGFQWAKQDAVADPDGSPDNQMAYNFGAQFSYAGFSLGGRFIQVTSGRQTSCGAAGVVGNSGFSCMTTPGFGMRGKAGAFGLRYATGPYAIGASCILGEAKGNFVRGSGRQLHETCAFAGTYTLGPGIRLVGGFFWFNDNANNPIANYNGVNVDANAEDYDTDGWGGTIGLKTSF